jgi:hypothetical protein
MSKDMFKAGYHGKSDVLRSNAEKMMGSEMKQSLGQRTSASAPSKLKPRLYKKGGSVKSKFADGGLIGDMQPSMVQPDAMNPAISQFKRGGHAKKKKYEMGGAIGNARMRIPVMPPKLMVQPGNRLAAGGVAKIRHNEATKSGAPKKGMRNKKGDPYC